MPNVYSILLLVAGIGAIVIGIRNYVRAKDSSDKTMAVVTLVFAAACLAFVFIVLPWLLHP
ncbi:MAG: hypothetical protein HYS13_18405 [Planctomycetia bacterium]|nr:hypothetical protein [Planctomycetia bacterium]